MAKVDVSFIRNKTALIKGRLRALREAYLSEQRKLKRQLRGLQKSCPHSSLPKHPTSHDGAYFPPGYQLTKKDLKKIVCNEGMICVDCGYKVPVCKDWPAFG